MVDRKTSSTSLASANLSSSFKNDASFILQQPLDNLMLSEDQGKDEEEYLEKVQETSCPVSLVDDKHKDILMRRLSTLRRNKEFCDVVLYASDEREIFCHKVVLAALSPRFYELFVGANGQTTPASAALSSAKTNGKLATFFPNGSSVNKKEELNGDVPGRHASEVNSSTNSMAGVEHQRLSYYEFRDVDYESLNAIVTFAYTGKLEITNDRVAQLYKAACLLRVQTCVKACAEYLLKMLNMKNCIGLRKCANRTSDLLLGNEIDLFILKHFSEIVCESNEFTSLPCIQINVFLSLDDKSSKFKRDAKLGEKVLEWLQRETITLPEHVEFRMELLTSRPYMLYVDSESFLHDCNDLDDNSSVGSCDLIQDYKKQNRLYAKKSKVLIGGPIIGSAHVNGTLAGSPSQSSSIIGVATQLLPNGPNSFYNDRLYSSASTESVCSLVSDNEECEWKLIAMSKNSENYYIMLAIVKRKLAAVSIRINDTPFYKPGAKDRLALLLAKSQENLSVTNNELLATMNDQRCNVGAVYHDGQLIVCGGNNRGECLKSVESFNIVTNKWSTLSPMLKERGRFGACVCDEKLYVVGGSDGSMDLSTVESYDPQANSWVKLSSSNITEPKSNNMVASVDGHVYNLGGFDGQAARRTCERYDPKTDQWEQVASMAVGRYQAGCCTWHDKIIVVGGCDTWSCLSSGEVYDPATNGWRPLPNMIAPRRGCGAAVLNNKLYVAGGSDGSQTLCSVEVLDLASPGTPWRTGPSLTVPRGNVRLVAADCRIYAVGGFSGKLFSNTIEYLDDGANEWRTTTPGSPGHTMTSSSPTTRAPSKIDEEPASEFSATLTEEK